MSSRRTYRISHAVRRHARALRRDDCGFTAVEFALVAPWFLMLLFGIMAVGLFFFTTFALENAVDQAARLIRTGQAQESGMTADQFKTKVCENAPGYVDCAGKMRVNVVSGVDPSTLAPPSCTDSGGALVPAASTTFTPGGSGNYVLVTVCYEMELASKIPFLHLGEMGNGSALIQAATTFKTEPYGSAPPS
jgi:Flp pilus assembly protein TadG